MSVFVVKNEKNGEKSGWNELYLDTATSDVSFVFKSNDEDVQD